MAKRRSYKKDEKLLTRILIGDAALFVLYMIFAASGLTALKVISTIVIIIASALCLAFLYLTGEIRKLRSRWLVLGFGCIILCLLVSLIFNYPAPAPEVAKTTASFLTGAIL